MKSPMAARILMGTLALFGMAACNQNDGGVEGYEDLQRFVKENRVGHAADFWIEMKNMAGEWEKTGLVFGYVDDFEECQKAIAGLKSANDAREYRCVPANT